MRPKQIKLPFDKNNPKLLVVDKIFYIPNRLDDYASFDPGLFFVENRSLHIEFCSGNGEWIVEKAKANPDLHFIAVEKDYCRLKQILSKRTNANLNNLFVVFGDAKLFTRFYLKESSVTKIYINFPDPWPKQRHQKHRLIEPWFVEELKRVLEPQSELIYVTDDEPHQREIKAIIQDSKRFHLLSEEPISDYGSSFFQRLWESKGKAIYYLTFKAAL